MASGAHFSSAGDTGFAARLGRVVAVHGSVVDIAFPAGTLPAIDEAVAIEWDCGDKVIAEVRLSCSTW